MPISAVPSLPFRTYSCSSVYWRSFGMFATGAPLRDACLTVGREVYGRLKTESRNADFALDTADFARDKAELARRLGCSTLKRAPERVDVALQILERSVVVDAVIGARPLELGRHLCRDHVHCLGLLETSRRNEPFQPQRSRRIDQNDGVELFDEVSLEEQRDDADSDRITALLCAGDLAVPQTRHARMHDPVESVELDLVREDNLPQRFAIEAAVGAEHVLAPPLDYVPKRLGIRLHRFARQLVGVDDGGAT